jgi:hypothetical protein
MEPVALLRNRSAEHQGVEPASQEVTGEPIGKVLEQASSWYTTSVRIQIDQGSAQLDGRVNVFIGGVERAHLA